MLWTNKTICNGKQSGSSHRNCWLILCRTNVNVSRGPAMTWQGTGAAGYHRGAFHYIDVLDLADTIH
jgi:hypothetical protein